MYLPLSGMSMIEAKNKEQAESLKKGHLLIYFVQGCFYCQKILLFSSLNNIDDLGLSVFILKE